MSRFAVMDPETGDWVEVTEEGIRLGLSLTDIEALNIARNEGMDRGFDKGYRAAILDSRATSGPGFARWQEANE